MARNVSLAVQIGPRQARSDTPGCLVLLDAWCVKVRLDYGIRIGATPLLLVWPLRPCRSYLPIPLLVSSMLVAFILVRPPRPCQYGSHFRNWNSRLLLAFDHWDTRFLYHDKERASKGSSYILINIPTLIKQQRIELRLKQLVTEIGEILFLGKCFEEFIS